MKDVKATVRKKAAALRLKHKKAADAAALVVAAQEQAAIKAADAAAATEQLRVHHEEAAMEAAALHDELERQEAKETAGYNLSLADQEAIATVVRQMDKPTLWRRFCDWWSNTGS
jgi:endonuclease/exonuclease/phosphatase (EEP) superfamily protein YafD